MRAFFLAITLMFLSGCTALQYAKENPEQAALAVKSGTLAFVEQVEPMSGRIQRAKQVVEVINIALSEVSSSSSATVTSLSSQIRDEIKWGDMDAYERLLLDSLIFSVESRLKERVGSGILNEDQRVVVRTVLEWAKEAANVYTQESV